MDCIVHGVPESWTRPSDFHYVKSPRPIPGLQEELQHQVARTGPLLFSYQITRGRGGGVCVCVRAHAAVCWVVGAGVCVCVCVCVRVRWCVLGGGGMCVCERWGVLGGGVRCVCVCVRVCVLGCAGWWGQVACRGLDK